MKYLYFATVSISYYRAAEQIVVQQQSSAPRRRSSWRELLWLLCAQPTDFDGAGATKTNTNPSVLEIHLGYICSLQFDKDVALNSSV